VNETHFKYRAELVLGLMLMASVIAPMSCKEQKSQPHSSSSVVNDSNGSVSAEITFEELLDQAESGQLHIIMQTLDRPHFLKARPEAKKISFDEYKNLKSEYAHRNKNWKPGYALVYREKEDDTWRYYSLVLESFTQKSAWIAELTQYKSKGHDWIARYQLKRNPEVDEELGIPRILKDRSRVIGGVKYGMSVEEVISKKGKHYKISHHAEAGSADLVYDDVKVRVRQWSPHLGKGRVVGVTPMTKEKLEFFKHLPYEDEK
jgi:hypothetical protein